MRIALVSDWFLPRLGGIELHLRDLALALRSRGLDARIVTTTPGPSEVDGVPVHRIASVRMPATGVALSPRVRAAIEALLAREAFDLVHAHASIVSPTSYAGMRAGSALGLPTVITFHSMLYQSASALAAADALLGWSRRVVITAVSSVVAAQLANRMPDADIGILGNGIDTAFWSRLPHATGGAGVRFVSAMRMSRKKRPLELVRAFAEAHRFLAGTPPIHLTIAGDGPDWTAAGRLAAELGIAAHVSLPGHLSREQLRELYASSDVFVLPSERESFGIAALEARGAGLPVIAMMPTGARDFIMTGVNGMLARDHAELSRFIARMALEPAARATMRVNNSRAPTEYDWRAVTDAHVEIYRAAATLRERPAAPTHK